MTQKEAVKIWVDGATEAMITTNSLFQSKRYHHALFFAHLALEKALKGYCVVTKDVEVPFSHDLAYIASKADIALDKQTIRELNEISEFNVSARYENFKYAIYKRATKEYTEKWISTVRKYYEKFLPKI